MSGASMSGYCVAMMRTRKGYTLAPTHCKFAVRDAARDCTLHVVSTPAAIAAKAEQDVARVSQTYESTAVESVHLLARLRVRGSGWLAERGVDASWKWDSVSILGVASLGGRGRRGCRK